MHYIDANKTYGEKAWKRKSNYTRMLRAILNKSWWQHPTKQQLYGHRPPITKTIRVRRTRNVGHCWRSRDELISDILLWTPSHGRAKARRPAQTYIQQLCADTGCSLEDLPEVMDDREGWRVSVWEIHADGAMMMMMMKLLVTIIATQGPLVHWMITSSVNTWKLKSLNFGGKQQTKWKF